MEYLMTYGWAILIIAVVLGALFSLGVFNGANFAPKAPPGACQVFRPNGPGSTSFINLEGVCSGELPQFAETTNTLRTMTTFNILSSQPPTSSGTLTFWLNPINPGSTNPAVFRLNLSNNFNLYGYMPGYYGSPTDLTVAVMNSINQNIGQNEFTIGNNVWVQVSLNFSGTAVLVYVNGINSGGISLSQSMGSFYFTKLAVGGFNGQLANEQLYNTSLSGPEVNALYLEGIGGAPIDLQNLVGWWPLNGNANDYSGNMNNGAPNNVVYTGSWESGYTAP